MPRVSVVIPTFDRPPFLREAVASVLAQTFGDWECIVSDDGSGPDGVETLEQLRKLDARISVVRGSHSGRLGRVRNRALACAAGEYVAFLDDDDLWSREKLARQVRILDAGPDTALLFARARRIGKARGAVPSRWLHERPGLEVLWMRNVIPCSTAMLRREILERVGRFDEELPVAQDYDLWLRIARVAPVRFDARVLAAIRVHPEAMTRLREQEAEALERIYSRLAALWDLPPRYVEESRRRVARFRARHRVPAGASAWSPGT